ncbi:MAG: S24/S26 family peptidase [Paludibacteraceae bacterium]|nr:S24/S26 family peptidase [Paludibacteraceae bacterium]
MKVDNDILIPELARLLREQKEVRFTPSGVSMRPFIEGDKDSVVLAPVTSALRRGDILLAQVQTLCGRQTYVLHRLIRIEGDELVMQGDGNLGGEERCKAADVIGRVKTIESPSGRHKPLTRGYVWYGLKPVRRYLLKIYRKIVIPLLRYNV